MQGAASLQRFSNYSPPFLPFTNYTTNSVWVGMVGSILLFDLLSQLLQGQVCECLRRSSPKIRCRYENMLIYPIRLVAFA